MAPHLYFDKNDHSIIKEINNKKSNFLAINEANSSSAISNIKIDVLSDDFSDDDSSDDSEWILVFDNL